MKQEEKSYWRPSSGHINYDYLSIVIQDFFRVKGIDITRLLIKEMLVYLFSTILTGVSRGDKVLLRGFGTFLRKRRAAKTRINPESGKIHHLPEKYAITYTPGRPAYLLLASIPVSNTEDRPKKKGRRKIDRQPIEVTTKPDTESEIINSIPEDSFNDDHKIQEVEDRPTANDFFTYEELNLDVLNNHINSNNQ